MRGRDVDRRDRGERRYKTNRQTERNLRGKGEMEDPEGSRLAQFAQGDLDRGDKGEEVKGLGGGGAEGTCDSMEGLVLDDLEPLDQGVLGGIRLVPELAAVRDDGDDASAVQEAHVVRGEAADRVAQALKSSGDGLALDSKDADMIEEGQPPVQVKTEPLDELGRGDGDGEPIKSRVEGGGERGRRGGESAFPTP